MGSWPSGVKTVSVLFGKGISPGGNMTGATLQVDPIFNGTTAVVWSTDGTPILPFSEQASAIEGAYNQVTLPAVDQPGFLDDGQHAYSMWAYRLTETPEYNGLQGTARTKFWQPMSGQTTVDFDLIPNSSLGLPMSGAQASVTSLNGLTGALTLPLGAPPLVRTAVKTGAYTASPSDLVPVDATNAAVTITLPIAPADKSRVLVKKLDASTNAVAVNSGGSDVFNKVAGVTSVSLALQNQAVTVQYDSATAIWTVMSDDLPLAQLDLRYPKSVSPNFTGTPTAPTAAANDSSTTIATTAFVTQAIAAGLLTDLPEWQPNHVYTASFIVVNPSGQIVQAIGNFTSGATYNASNWAILSLTIQAVQAMIAAQAASDAAAYVHYDGAHLTQAGTVVPVGGNGLTIVDNGDGTSTLTSSGSASVTDNGDGTTTIAA